MKKLFGYIIIVCVPATIVLMLITFFTEQSLKKQKEGAIGKLNELFSGEENYDALLLGSSRTLVQVNPRIIDSALNINSFNAGFDGISLVECKMILNAYLKKHKPPRLLILNIDLFTLYINDSTKIFDYPVYFPYLDDPEIKRTVFDYSPSTKILSAFPFLRIAFLNDYKKEMAIKAIMDPNGKPGNIFYKGYSPHNLKWKGEKLNSKSVIHYSQKGFDLLNEMLNICHLHGIKPIVIYAPQTEELTCQLINFNIYKKLIRESCNKSNTEFYDYSEVSLSKDQNYFYNHLHLNSEGADLFTKMLADDLKMKPGIFHQ